MKTIAFRGSGLHSQSIKIRNSVHCRRHSSLEDPWSPLAQGAEYNESICGSNGTLEVRRIGNTTRQFGDMLLHKHILESLNSLRRQTVRANGGGAGIWINFPIRMLRVGCFCIFLISSITVATGRETTAMLLDPDFQLVVETNYARPYWGLAVLVLPDGRILLGGNFQDYARSGRKYLVRLNADGSVDDTFNGGGPGGVVSGMALQPDGRLFVAGPSILKRINLDGSEDTTFRPAIAIDGNDSYGEFQALLLTEDKLYIAQHVPRNNIVRIVRLNLDGSVDITLDQRNSFSNGFTTTIVNHIARQSDGRLLISGGFSSFGSQPVAGFLRMNRNGTLDASFTSPPSASLLEVDDRDRIYATVPISQNTPWLGTKVIRLTADGTIDPGFETPRVTGGHIGPAVLLADGKLIVAGTFQEVDGVRRVDIARFEENGSLALDFDPVTSTRGGGTITSLALQSDGKVLAAGFAPFVDAPGQVILARFRPQIETTVSLVYLGLPELSVREDAGLVGLTIVRAGKTDTTTILDYEIVPSISATAAGYRPQTGRVVFEPTEQLKTITIPIIDNEIPDDGGSLRIELRNPIPSETVLPIAATTLYIQDDDHAKQKPFIYFAQTKVEISEIDPLLRLWLRTQFSDNLAYQTNDVTVRYTAVSGTAIASEDFPPQTGLIHFYKREIGVWQAIEQLVIRISDDSQFEGEETFYVKLSDPTSGMILGTNDTLAVAIRDNDNPGGAGRGANDFVGVLSTLPDDRILAGGEFTCIDGIFRPRIARLNSDTTLDTSFHSGSGADATVQTLAVQSDGKIVLGGDFKSFDGNPRRNIVRLQSNGTIDLTFDPGVGPGPDPGTGAGPSILSMALQQDGKIVVGGFFGSWNGLPRPGIARLLKDGSLDHGFAPTFGSGAVFPLAIQSDGKLLVNGLYNDARGLHRLNGDGLLDETFKPKDYFNPVPALAVRPDGTIVTGGNYADIRPSRNGLVLLGGGITLVGGTGGKGLARIFASGALDSTFQASVQADTSVFAVAVQSNGEIVIGGTFKTINGRSRIRLARLDSKGRLIEQVKFRSPLLEPDGTSVLSLDGYSTSPFTIQVSTNLIDWVSSQTVTNIEGTLRVSLPEPSRPSQKFFRVRP